MKTIQLDWVTYNLVPVEEETIQQEIVPSEREVFGGKGYFANYDSTIRYTTEKISVTYNKNIVPRKEQAEAILALSQLIQLRDETWRRDGNWKPVIEKTYVITNEHWKMVEDDFNHYKEIFSFRTEEIRDEFLEKHRPLIEKLLALYV